MKRMMLLSLLLLSIGLQSYTCWEEDGKAIRQETNFNYSGEVIKLSDGGYMLMWSDASSGLQEMKVQKVSSEGDNIWDEPVVLTTRECYYPNGEVLVESIGGEVICAWYELGDPGLLRLQKIDEEGTLLWGETGLIFELEAAVQDCFDFEIVSDGAGSVYLIWLNEEGQNEIKALYVNADGEVPAGWDNSGLVLFGSNSYPQSLSVLPDGFGGIIIATRNSGNYILLQRCDNQANLHWGAEGITMPDLEADYKMSLLPWSVGEYAVIVEQDDGFWANTFDYSGNFGFSEMRLIAPVDSDGNYKMLEGVKTSDGKLGMIWYEQEGLLSYIITQKTEIGGEPEWGEDGILLGSCEYGIVNMAVSADETGGLVLSWGELEGDIYSIMYHHLDSNGNAVNGVEPQLTGLSYNYWHALQMFRDSGSSILFWQQYKEDRNELVMQIYDSAENPQLAEEGNVIWDVLAGTTHKPYLLKAKGNISAISWCDERYPQSQIYLQAINNDTGDLWYEPDGIAATAQSDLEENYENFCISENCERICVTYGVETDMYYMGGIQILDQDGNRLLGEDGMLLSTELEYVQSSIASTGENEFVIVWKGYNYDFINPEFYLNIQKVVDDQFVWGDGINLLTDGNDIDDINLQYPYITWLEWNWPNRILRLTKITDDGNIAPGWSSEGIIVVENYRPESVRLYQQDLNITLFWIEENDGGYLQLKGQRYSSQGGILWEEDGRTFSEQMDAISDHQVLEGYIYYLGLTLDGSYILDKYSLAGEQVWDESINFGDYNTVRVRDFSVWEDAIIVYETDLENDDIYAYIYDTDGNMIDNFPPDGLEICTQQHEQDIISCACDDNGSSIVLWEDKRGEFMPHVDPSLYVQKIDLSTVPVTEDDIPGGNLVNMSNYPNPFTRSTILKCDLPRNIEEAEIMIYNIKGQKVRSLPATSNEVEWDCRNQAGNIAGSGVYFYVLQGKNIKSKTGKMIMLR